MVRILQGDCLEVLRTLPDASVQTCVTSPPYYGLRDYGVEGQVGLEETPELYVARLVAIFSEVRRVLRDDGTLWLNLGDSYAGSGKGSNPDGTPHPSTLKGKQGTNNGSVIGLHSPQRADKIGLKPKDLIGIPWRVAFALQSDGWWLRSDIIWHKPNPMPESVTDRPTKAHEYIFLLSKAARYYYDHKAIKEPLSEGTRNDPRMQDMGRKYEGKGRGAYGETGKANGSMASWSLDISGRNKRDVWTVSTKPYSGAHFAVFPPDLIEPCVLAGAPAGGVVLDPFCGSGTTGAVAKAHGREFIGIELNPEYIALAWKRIDEVQAPLFTEAEVTCGS